MPYSGCSRYAIAVRSRTRAAAYYSLLTNLYLLMATLRTDAATIQQHLVGVDYPAQKSDLIKAAQKNSASDEVLSDLRNLPDQEYGSPTDVMEALSDDAEEM